jgi:competence protein ComEC
MARVGPALGMPCAERASVASPIAWLVRQLEAEQERWFLWLPVMFGGGIALYFLLPVEPWTIVALLPVVAALAVHLTVARGAMAALMTGALLATALGVAAAKLRTEAVRAPVLQKQVGPVDVYGFVELVEPRAAKGQRLTVRVTALEKHEAHEWPYRVRTMTEAPSLEPGDAVRLKATLSPPPGPALPGDYDFARAAWFQGLGAVGYATSAPELVTSAVEPPLGLRVSAAVARLRQAIGRRVVEALPGQTGAIANALITGKQRRA